MKNTTKKTLLGFTASFVALAASVSLAGAQTTSPLTCSPSTTSIVMNQSATFFASGGDTSLSYNWSIPNATLTNPVGSSFTVSYNTPGTRIVTVTNGSNIASCTLIVNQSAALVPTPVVTFPTVPSTGAGGLFDQNVLTLLLVIGSASVAGYQAKKLGDKNAAK